MRAPGGALSTVPSVRGAFPDTPILQGGYPVRDDQAGLDFTNHHHLGAGFGVDVIFRLGAPQQGTTGWLFRGKFLEQTLKKGEVIDMDATWLLHCAADA